MSLFQSNPRLERYVWTTSCVIACMVAFQTGSSCSEERLTQIKDAELQQALSSMATKHEETERVHNREVGSISELLAKTKSNLDAKTKEAAVLAELLRDRPTEVRYITKVETVIQPAKPKEVASAEPPAEYLYKLDNGLVVARFAFEKGDPKPFRFQTYAQRWVLRGAIGEEKSSFLLFGSTGYDDELRPIPVEVEVTGIAKKPRKLFMPKLAMGATLGVAVPKVGLEYGASVLLPLVHPLPTLDLLAPRAFIGSNLGGGFVFRGGLDLLGYNVGDPAPLVDDFWIFVGGSFGTDRSASVDLTFATRL